MEAWRMTTAHGSAADVPALRVATVNVWGWYFPVAGSGIGRARPDVPPPRAWAARQSALRAGLRALRPDLVALQEVITTDGYDQAADLLGPGYHLAHQRRREADGSGVSIASRWPLGGVHEVDLDVTPRTADFPCVTLLAEVRAPGPVGRLLFANHKPSYRLDLEHERELQAVAAARTIEQRVSQRAAHVVVAGDMDATPESASLRFWRGLQSLDGLSVCYRNAWEHVHPGDPGHTFTPRNPLLAEGTWPLERGRRIDHVLVRCGSHGPTLEPRDCSLLFDEPVDGVWASDHFGVMADLVVAPQPPVVPS
jgi:endonuclease/exonuclease/phosphatase family metal-dependent hydrolase